MPTTFANTINGNELLAKRSQCDYAGNDLQTTYATKTEVTTGLSSKEDSSNKAQTLDPSSSTEFPSSAATANYVNSSVATATANFLGNFTLQELGLTYPATDAQIGTALDAYTWPAGVTPTNNDYTYIEIENPQTTGIDDAVERFKFNGTNWVYEYTLNNSSFTAAEKAAIDSGIDSTKVTAYDTHVADTDIHVTLSDKSTWNAKQDAISDLATIRSGASAGATAVQPGDLATVATTGAYSDLSGTPTIPSGTQLVPAATSADADKVLTVDSLGIPAWAASQGLFIAQYGTTTYNEVDTAASAGKIVYCDVNGRFAFLAYKNTAGDNNYEFQYYRSAPSGIDSVFVYKVRQTGWETIERSVKAGNIRYPVTQVNVNGSSAMTGTVANITIPAAPTVDQTYDSTSTNAQSGTAVAGAISGIKQVPASTVSDADKVLKVNAQGTPEWATGGGTQVQSDWTEADNTEPSYIQNKPVPKTLTAGTGISITEGQSAITIANTAPDVPIGSWEDVSTEVQYNTTPILAGGFEIKYNASLKLVSVTADVNLDAGAANIFTWTNRLKPVANAFALGNGLTLYVSQTSLNQPAGATQRWVNGVWMWPVVGGN